MRVTLFHSLWLSLLVPSLGAAPAQPPVAVVTPPTPAPATAGGAVEKRTQRIHIEDAGTRIDELRVGGETQTITVQPKGGMPAYDVRPTSGARSWKILDF